VIQIKFLGVLLIVLGSVLGLYLGVWIMFIGGIVGLIEAVNIIAEGSGVDTMLIGINIVKLMFAGFIGYVSALIFIIPGLVLFNK